MGKNKKQKLRAERTDQSPRNRSEKVSILGWIVLLGPVLIVLLVTLLGERIPYLQQQSELGARDEAAKTVRFGKESLKANRLQEAYGYFQRAISILPDFAQPYIHLSEIFYRQGNLPAAIDQMKKAISLDPPQKDLLLNNLGLLYARQGEQELALEMFERAAALGVSLDQVYTNAGHVLLEQGKAAQAAEAYRNAVAHTDTPEGVYVEMLRKATIDYAELEQDTAVVAKATLALKQGVSQADLERYDWTTLMHYKRDPERLAKRHHYLSRALEKTGKVSEAVKAEKQAAVLDPDNADYRYRTARLLSAMGRTEQAEQWYRKTLEINPRHGGAAQALGRIE